MLDELANLVALNLSLHNTGSILSLPAQFVEYVTFRMLEWAGSKVD